MKQTKNAAAIIKRIRQYHRVTECSLLWLSAKAGLHRNTLNRLHEPDFNPTANTLDSVVKYLDSI
jgi:DNA-binding phage protein